MSLEQELKSIDTERVMVIADKVISHIPTAERGELMELSEEYEALNDLIARANDMSENLYERMEAGEVPANSDTISFLRGITAGVWIAAAVLREYAETETFEKEFGDS